MIFWWMSIPHVVAELPGPLASSVMKVTKAGKNNSLCVNFCRNIHIYKLAWEMKKNLKFQVSSSRK